MYIHMTHCSGSQMYNTNCIMLCVPCSEALQVATFIRKNAKRPTCRFSGSLEIGSKLKIPVKIFTKVGEERGCAY